MRRFFLLLISMVVLVLGIAIPARAHASLERSVPKSGEILLESPSEIILEFNEDLDPTASEVELYDGSGKVVVPGPGVIDASEPLILRLKTETLPDGVYSAIWHVRSAVDGHFTNGTVGFSIGLASPQASLLPPPGTPDPATVIPDTFETIVRWLAYLSAAVGFGSLTFGFLIWRRAYRRDMNQSEASDEAIRQLIRRVTLGSLASLAVATLAFALIQTSRALELSLWTTLVTSFSQMFVSRNGMLWGLRLILIVILAVLVLRLPSPGAGSSKPWLLLLFVGSGILFTFSLQGHGAAHGSEVEVALYWLHLVATAVWLGGLPLFVIALRRSDIIITGLGPRYSDAALISVGIIAATGLYQALVHVRTIEALTSTTYGRMLLGKTVIFALLFALGGINLFVLSSRIQQSISNARNWMVRTVRIEMTLGALLLLAVGILTGVSPAFDALETRQAQGFMETVGVDDVDMLVRVAPLEEGENEIGVEFTDRRTGVMSGAPEVLFRLRMIEMDLGEQQVRATSEDGRRYTARGSYFTMIGPWELEVIIRRPGYNDVRQTFELEIQEKSSP
jgi:copper transport protein